MDTEKLIELVYERKALWDMLDKNYSKRHVSKRLWDEVADAMATDVMSVRNKWRGLRDTFRKRFKEVEEGSGDEAPSKDCTWPYYESLLFLADTVRQRPHQHAKPATRSTRSSDQNSSAADPPSPPAQPSAPHQNQASITSATQNGTPSRPPFKRPRPDRYHADESSRVEQQPPADQDKIRFDSDYQFLMSLYPYLRDTPANRKLYVRSKLHQVFIQEMEQRSSGASSMQPRGQSPLSSKEPPSFPSDQQQHQQNPNPIMQRHYNHPESESSADPQGSHSLISQQRMTLHAFY